MIQGSKIKFGITSDLSGLSQGIIVNSIQKNNVTDSAQARDQLGNVIDIAAYSDDKNVTIDGMYVSQSLKPGTIINIDNQNYMVTSTGREELNTAFQTASINARLFPGGVVPPTPPEPIVPNPSLMFKGADDEGTYIQLNRFNAGSLEAINLVYRKNNGPWTTYNIGDILALNKGDVVFLSGVNDHFSKDSNNFYYFTIDGKVEASGNIMSLMNFSDSCTNNCFYSLFRDCDDLLTAPDLSATELAYGCYKSTFLGCTSLSTAPQLPVTTLKTSCYSNMFNGCSSLTTAPNLPASTLAIDCYNYMFANCSSLLDAPYLPAETLTITCYNYMFYNCTSLSSISVEFTNWNQTYSTLNWVHNVAPTGVFTKPDALSEEYGDSRIPEEWRDPVTIPLTFIGVNSTNAVQLSAVNSPNAITLDYSKNNGPWTTYNVGDIIELNQNETVAFSGANEYFSSYNQIEDTRKCYTFIMTGYIKSKGNTMSLLNWNTALHSAGFYDLFNGCSSLLTPPILPVSSVGAFSCRRMFKDCTSLTVAPQLPAIEIGKNCYQYMFQNCYALQTSPSILPATTLAYSCYQSMFQTCPQLKDAPQLPATTLTNWCYDYMFDGCQNLSSISVSFTDWTDGSNVYIGTQYWVRNVAASGIFTKPEILPDLKATYMNHWNCIPSGWTVVNKDDSYTPLTFKGLSSTNVICLSAHGTPDPIVLKAKINDGEWNSVTVDQYTYYTARLNQGDTIAFSGANDHFSKNYINFYQFTMTGTIEASGNIQSLLNFSDSVNSYCYAYMFSGCTSLTTPPQLPATGLAGDCYYNMFYNCTSLTSAPALPASTLAEQCYYEMFKNCTSLTVAPQLPAITLAWNCYCYMFDHCFSLTSAPALPATTLAHACYHGMFRNCTSLTSTPQLPATTLAEACYYQMFAHCTNLSSIEVSFTDWTQATNATYSWVGGVAANGTFYKPAALSTVYGASRIPEGWYVVEEQVEYPEPEEPPPSEQV